MDSMGTRCVVCDATPARKVPIARNVGMLYLRRAFRMQPTVCRSCGLAITRNWLLRTLVQGWWGVISFITNLAFVISDVVTLIKLRRLAEPLHDQAHPKEEVAERLKTLKGGRALGPASWSVAHSNDERHAA